MNRRRNAWAISSRCSRAASGYLCADKKSAPAPPTGKDVRVHGPALPIGARFDLTVSTLKMRQYRRSAKSPVSRLRFEYAPHHAHPAQRTPFRCRSMRRQGEAGSRQVMKAWRRLLARFPRSTFPDVPARRGWRLREEQIFFPRSAASSSSHAHATYCWPWQFVFPIPSRSPD